MKTLVLGGGGREHALAWKIAESRGQKNVLLAPGNAGTKHAGFSTLDCPVETTVPELVTAARLADVDLVVIGPEVLLADGYADAFREEGFLVFGPGRDAARLETSKAFAKEFMARADVPTAKFRIADSYDSLLANLGTELPIVLKLDGLAAGKGVVIAHARSEAEAFASRIWLQGEFGKGPHRVVIEEHIAGKELSYMGLCDGKRFLPLSSATDYKRVHDDDQGPNTGGMGAVSPSPHCNPELEKKIDERIVSRILRQFDKEGWEYRGLLYIGLMITQAGDPYVLEFNARFGDPETQAVVLRFQGDFNDALKKTAEGRLDEVTLKFSPNSSIYVVAAAEGYPAAPKLGDTISGLDDLPGDTRVFFSGVQEKSGFTVTSGGRVLGVGAMGSSAAAAREKVYAALSKIHWRGMHYRRDIGKLS